MHQDIVLVADYHDRNIEFLRFEEANGKEDRCNRANTREGWLKILKECQAMAAGQGGRVVLIMESTTGWARIKSLCPGHAELVLANVLQIPLPPKARRRKTDKIDTSRILREYRNGSLERSFQPRPSLRRLRRLVGHHASLTKRQTALRNWVNRYLAHETWRERRGLWSQRGQGNLRRWIKGIPRWDRMVLQEKLDELDDVGYRLVKVRTRLGRIARRWSPARRLDQIDGLGALSAVGIAACIGPVARFASAEGIIAYAGLAPGIRESDESRRDGHIGGGGTDKLLRHYLIEATQWSRRIPRYRASFERMKKRRGVKVAKLHLSRMMLRSIDAMLRYGREFDPQKPKAGGGARGLPLPSPAGGSPPEGGVEGKGGDWQPAGKARRPRTGDGRREEAEPSVRG